MNKICTALFLACLSLVRAAPSDFGVAGEAQVSGTAPKLFNFENGNVGVNFLGFKASAGLGGLLTGDAAHGGLHAEAGTPYGQAARAGLGGNVDGEGKSVGGLYADATAGGGVAAGAGLAGTAASGGTYGTSYAGASAGGAGVYKTKEVSPAVEVIDQETPAAFVAQKQIKISSAPVVRKEVEIVEEVQPKKTYIERTVIPNYQEKTIYVPSYVEKTVRVPTVVEQKVRVPVAPTIVEKTVEVPPENIKFDASVEEKIVPTSAPVTVYRKTKIRTRPFFRKQVYFGGYGGGYGSGTEQNVGGTGSFTVRKAPNPQLINDIFAIPISTLGAVSKLVGGIVGGTSASGSISVSKSSSASAYL